MMKEFSFLDGVGYLFPVFLSRFGAFLTSPLTFAQQLVQPPQHLVICAHSSSFSFLQTNCICFWTCSNCCRFITLPFAYVMSVQINYTCECWIIVIPYKTNSPHFIAWVITYKNVVKIHQANFTFFKFIF